MTEKEVVQALRCCADGECKDCAMHEDKQRCQENLLDKAAETIERLTAENAALREKQRWIPVTERPPVRRSSKGRRRSRCARRARREEHNGKENS